LDGERYAVPNVTTKAKRMDIAVAPDYSWPGRPVYGLW
jgi:hypothetical protein